MATGLEPGRQRLGTLAYPPTLYPQRTPASWFTDEPSSEFLAPPLRRMLCLSVHPKGHLHNHLFETGSFHDLRPSQLAQHGDPTARRVATCQRLLTLQAQPPPNSVSHRWVARDRREFARTSPNVASRRDRIPPSVDGFRNAQSPRGLRSAYAHS